jgi:L-ribulose-5-phosphate 4-epimerase
LSLADLKAAVAAANRAIDRAGLVTLSFGNASGVDRAAGVLVIKPSGGRYAELTAGDMVVVALEDGRLVEGALRPSVDTPTHRLLYLEFPEIGGIVHTHSAYASAWAQAQRSIPCLGTTHADHFRGPVPVTRELRPEEVAGEYELATGKVIVETLERHELSAADMPAVLVASHGPFVWGPSVGDAVNNAIALEAVATMASQTFALAPGASGIQDYLLERHFQRKHGSAAYYGQAGRDLGGDLGGDPGGDPGKGGS